MLDRIANNAVSAAVVVLSLAALMLGTMQVVLTRQIVLSKEEKAVAVGKLREAFAEHQRQKAGEPQKNPGQVIEGRH